MPAIISPEAMMRSGYLKRDARISHGDGLLAACRGEGLRIALQPIFSLTDATVHGYEALLRPPEPWSQPLKLIQEAHGAGLGVTLELSAMECAIREFARQRLPGRLFVNLGAGAMQASGSRDNAIVQCALNAGIEPHRIVVELTEREPVNDMDNVIETMRMLRSCGLGIALDDFGQGYSGLRLWLELRPDIVKVDQYFITDMHQTSAKLEALKCIVRLARELDTALIGEGVETAEELSMLRDLGVGHAQGYLLARPQFDPVQELPAEVRGVLGSAKIAVYPEKAQVHAPFKTVGQLVKPIPATTRDATNQDIADILQADTQIHAIAVLDDGRPIGIINRQAFLDRLHKPFHQEVFGRRSCATFMNPDPLVVEAQAPIESLMDVLSSEDQRYLSDGFIIVENGRYLGLGTGEALVRSVSAIRIEAARHANPLTFLPGNIPITEHITRLLSRRADFVAAYIDLDNFKPYNDQYGYWRGDEMIKLAAATLLEHINPIDDFVGHVGGDDFVVLLQSEDWASRCQTIVDTFRERARSLYDDTDIARGGVHSEDRLGNPAFFPLTTMSIGVVEVQPGRYRSPEAVASRAAAAKRIAKKMGNCVARLPAITEDPAEAPHPAPDQP